MRSHEFAGRVRYVARQADARLKVLENEAADHAANLTALEARRIRHFGDLASLQLELGQETGDAAHELELRSNEMAALREDLVQLESRLSFDLSALEHAKQDLTSLAQAGNAALQEHAEYAACMAEIEQAEAAYQHYLEMAAEIRGECNRKLAKYEQDILYSYLRQIAYGTPEYKAGSVKKIGDKWIARQSNFHVNWENEQRLRLMQAGLESRGVASSERLQKAKRALQTLSDSTDKSKERGILDERVTALQENRRRNEQRSRELRQRLVDYGERNDSRYRKASELMAQTARHIPVEVLLEQARGTADTRDDDILMELSDLQREIQTCSESHQAILEEMQQMRNRRGLALMLDENLLKDREHLLQAALADWIDLEALLEDYWHGRKNYRQVRNILAPHMHATC
ncbi:hypothetical protein [Massilia sp. BJB1822]|uniref:hypothetical protein n=1 Tax=Massilia sp. BJB1822 TaxID=2744470 RepID=UPI00159438F5|nr:hypothetical protein [Massilia sp. BJB1822]NVE00780.1 hypothetical protein [Massilia sp. BJB1822]